MDQVSLWDPQRREELEQRLGDTSCSLQRRKEGPRANMAPETLGQRDQYVLPGSTRKKYLYFIQLSWT